MLHEMPTEKIIGCCIEVRTGLGPGLLESVYESAPVVELRLAGLDFQQQLPLPVLYKGAEIGTYRIDLLVENAVVIELQSTERHEPVYEAQLPSYMKLGGYKVGLLINFNSTMATRGIRRFVL